VEKNNDITARPASVQERTLRRACELLGGSEQQLARALVVPLAMLKVWLEGEEAPPAWVFLRAVDIVNQAEGPIQCWAQD